MLSQIVRAFSSRGGCSLPERPPHNNLKELFSLLNFICPEYLDSFLHKDSSRTEVEEEKSKMVVDAGPA